MLDEKFNEISNEISDLKNPEKVEFSFQKAIRDIIEVGTVTGEKEIVDNFTIKLKTLSASELLYSEMLGQSLTSIPVEATSRIRAAGILSQALLEINGVPIIESGDSKEDEKNKRRILFGNLLDMPPYIVQKSYAFYIALVQEQNEKFGEIEKVDKEIENF